MSAKDATKKNAKKIQVRYEVDLPSVVASSTESVAALIVDEAQSLCISTKYEGWGKTKKKKKKKDEEEEKVVLYAEAH